MLRRWFAYYWPSAPGDVTTTSHRKSLKHVPPWIYGHMSSRYLKQTSNLWSMIHGVLPSISETTISKNQQTWLLNHLLLFIKSDIPSTSRNVSNKKCWINFKFKQQNRLNNIHRLGYRLYIWDLASTSCYLWIPSTLCRWKALDGLEAEPRSPQVKMGKSMGLSFGIYEIYLGFMGWN